MANEQVPVVQLIKPSELEAVVARRVKEGTVGTRAQKRTSKGKGKGKQPVYQLDPSQLRIDATVFATQAGKQLSQIPVQQISMNASGVVLASPSLAEPYLTSGKVVSAGALAMVILCTESALPSTQLPLKHVQFPAE